MIGIVVATLREAKGLLDRLSARKAAEAPLQQYMAPAAGARPACLVVISGMGKAKAARATEFLLDAHKPSAVLNVGLCGALSRDLPRGAQLRIASAVDGDSILAGRPAQAEPCSPAVSCGLPRVGNLASVDEPVFDDRRRAALAEYADVVDMEGWAIAHVCRGRHVPVHLLKAVSDFADAGGQKDIQKHVDTISALLAETVLKELETFVDPGRQDAASPEPGGGATAGPARPAGRGPSNVLARVCRLVKIEHTLFSLPLLLAGAWLGAKGGWPSWVTLALIVLAGAGARTLGMASNRILDRHLDALNPRTAGRDLPAARMSLAAALTVAAGGLAVYLAACAALGPLCLVLSPVPAAAMALYPLLKRFTHFCHFGIGICQTLGPLGAYVAASGSLPAGTPTLALALFTFLWMSGFDIIYALQDIASDRRTGVRSLPASLGPAGGEAVAAAVHLLAAAAGVWLWQLVGGRAWAGLAAAVMIAGFAAAHWPRMPEAMRFFPIGPIVGVAGALVVLLGELR